METGITRDHFLKSSKQKYVATFKWITLLNFVTFIYSFIYISNKYGDMIRKGSSFWDTSNNFQNIHNAIYLLSYTFTFCMPYYALWIISQYDVWVNLTQSTLKARYTESEYSVNNFVTGHNGHSNSNDRRLVPESSDIKEEIQQNERIRIKSETEMSISSAQRISNSYNLKAALPIKRSKAKVIKRESFKRRNRKHAKSEGGKPLDINAMYNNGLAPLAMSPSIPENYDQIMTQFDPSNIPQFPEESYQDMSLSQSYDQNVRNDNKIVAKNDNKT